MLWDSVSVSALRVFVFRPGDLMRVFAFLPFRTVGRCQVMMRVFVFCLRGLMRVFAFSGTSRRFRLVAPSPV